MICPFWWDDVEFRERDAAESLCHFESVLFCTVVFKREYDRRVIRIFDTELHDGFHGLVEIDLSCKGVSMLDHGSLGSILP